MVHSVRHFPQLHAVAVYAVPFSSPCKSFARWNVVLHINAYIALSKSGETLYDLYVTDEKLSTRRYLTALDALKTSTHHAAHDASAQDKLV